MKTSLNQIRNTKDFSFYFCLYAFFELTYIKLIIVNYFNYIVLTVLIYKAYLFVFVTVPNTYV